ncbi:DUF4062 domain-containing protein [Nonomuraea sp. NN258]|uniref:DUF4062 domain-containing protein n=1 Tax=Nonomuraea antri TaxID=2730852 RepID=UPI00156890E6|nr:DUF4062 domain-containing protein [Nonomuraea antri]NRQ30617.1 DUF4062 domain-containing protein [Nonomuraea antri]
MAYTATVFRVMIASPSDVAEARDAVEKAIHGWNDANAKNKGVVLQPWRWETSAVPELGGHPQSLINSQGVDSSDIVIALFGSRLGSPTPEAASGTAEEIQRAVAHGKPVHVYFSMAPLPNDVDTAQLDGLRQFRKQLEPQGILGEFHNPSQLEHEVWKAIEHDLAKISPVEPVLQHDVAPTVDFIVQPQGEREISGSDTKGNPKYRTRRWLEVTNRGTSDAEKVSFEVLGNSGLLLMTSEASTVIHAGQTRTIPMELPWVGGSDAPVVRLHWIESDQPQFKDFHVG